MYMDKRLLQASTLDESATHCPQIQEPASSTYIDTDINTVMRLESLPNVWNHRVHVDLYMIEVCTADRYGTQLEIWLTATECCNGL